MKWYKNILLVVGILVLAWLAYAFFDHQFRLANVQGEWPQISSTPLTHLQHKQLQEIFSQPFHYLDRGKQSFAFISQDNQYVLKLFDARCLRSGAFSFLFPISSKKCKKKLVQLFNGYQVGSLEDPKYTGLIAVQLVPDSSYILTVRLMDRFGFRHDINLAELPFVLQQKAVPLRELITTLLKAGHIQEAKDRLDQVHHMYVAGYQAGIYDLDHNFMYNTGFIGNQPIRIDLGRLQYREDVKDPAVYRQDLKKLQERFRKWMERHFTELTNIKFAE